MARTAAILVSAKSALVLLLLVVSQVAFSATQQVALKSQVKWQPPRPVSGSPILFQVSAPAGAQSVSAVWMNHEVIFFRAAKTNFWYGLAGVSLETAPGTYDLRLTETLADSKSVETLQRIKISRAVYPKITVKVAKQYTEPSPEQLTEISADKNVKQMAFAAENPQRLWAGQFVAPIQAQVSDVFGTARVFNQQVQSRHQGLDYAAPSGTPVHAVNRGTVIMARPLFFEGNCVVVDHGQGLLSLYLHLSEFKVKEGEEIQTGQVIALSGGTGRASGPHLHLAIRWHGVYLDPRILLKLKLPTD
jgi:murein DD-endopeptidase MepM/ murein hydrolase activator NlpD